MKWGFWEDHFNKHIGDLFMTNFEKRLMNKHKVQIPRSPIARISNFKLKTSNCLTANPFPIP